MAKKKTKDEVEVEIEVVVKIKLDRGDLPDLAERVRKRFAMRERDNVYLQDIVIQAVLDGKIETGYEIDLDGEHRHEFSVIGYDSPLTDEELDEL